MIDPDSSSPAVFGFFGVIAGSLISWAIQERVLQQRIAADERKTRQRFDFDKELAERRFKYDRALSFYKRKAEVAERAIIAVSEVREALRNIRIPSPIYSDFDNEEQYKYFVHQHVDKSIPYFSFYIRRVRNEEELFAKLRSLKFESSALFGEEAVQSFDTLLNIFNQIGESAIHMIQLTQDGHDTSYNQNRFELEVLGRQPNQGHDPTDNRIAEAVRDIEKTCRSFLTNIPALQK